MSISMNIHPKDKWVQIQTSLYDEGQGACINLTFLDYNSSACISIHYGKEENRDEFVKMFKESVSKLP